MKDKESRLIKQTSSQEVSCQGAQGREIWLKVTAVFPTALLSKVALMFSSMV
jgi:hypothetical protein